MSKAIHHKLSPAADETLLASPAGGRTVRAT
jgi:hypothetical protein